MKVLKKADKHPKLLYTCHNLPNIMLANNNADLGAAVRDLVKNNNLQLVALHDEMAKELNAMFEVNNTAVIRNGIDMDRFKNESVSCVDIRRELGIPEDSFVVGHVGRFVNQKNHQFLVEVFKKIYTLNQKAFLLLVGSGPLEAQIMDKTYELGIRQNMKILNHRSDIHRILKAMDRFVFPSLWEGLGIVAIEAQAAGLKCIVSEQVPDDAIITNQVLKLDLDAGVDIWADAVINPRLPEQIKGDYISYDMKQVVKQLEGLYR